MSEEYKNGPHIVYDIQYHLWERWYFCASVGKAAEKMIEAYIERQDKALPKDVFKVSDE